MTKVCEKQCIICKKYILQNVNNMINENVDIGNNVR